MYQHVLTVSPMEQTFFQLEVFMGFTMGCHWWNPKILHKSTIGLACEASCEWWEPYLVHLRGIKLVTDHTFPMVSLSKPEIYLRKSYLGASLFVSKS